MRAAYQLFGGLVVEEIGLVYEGDHLTASWLVNARFRDYLGQRLQGDFVAFVPLRNRLTAIRADEADLIARIQRDVRRHRDQPLWLTPQGFHVSSARTGGLVSVYGAARDPCSTV